MAIFEPENRYSRVDRRLIALLAELLGDVPNDDAASNRVNFAVASEDNISELIELIEDKLEDREFFAASALIDAVSARDRDAIRDNFLTGRTRASRKRALASKQTSDFLVRLGIDQRGKSSWYVPTDRMSKEHFLRMEERSLRALNLSPKVVDLAMRYVELELNEVEKVRDGERRLNAGLLRASLKATLDSLRVAKRGADYLLDPNRLTGTLVITVNVGVLYTTRDWSVAGTLSGIAGALGTMHPRNKA